MSSYYYPKKFYKDGDALDIGYDRVVERALNARQEKLKRLAREGKVWEEDFSMEELKTILAEHPRDDQIRFDKVPAPDEDEIVRRAAEIRAGWSEEEREKRMGALAPEDAYLILCNEGALIRNSGSKKKPDFN